MVNGPGGSTESRLALLEYQVLDQARNHRDLREEFQTSVHELRKDMNSGFKDMTTELVKSNNRSRQQLFATWTLVCSLLASAAAFYSAFHFH